MGEFVDRLITDREAAPICGATVHMLRLARSRGWIWEGIPGPKFAKLGRSVRYRISDIHAWMEALQAVRSNAEHYASATQQQQERS